MPDSPQHSSVAAYNCKYLFIEVLKAELNVLWPLGGRKHQNKLTNTNHHTSVAYKIIMADGLADNKLFTHPGNINITSDSCVWPMNKSLKKLQVLTQCVSVGRTNKL